jgi:hypothetical protein
MCKKIKTNEDRLERIQQLAKDNIGPVRSVSLSLKGNSYRCILKMASDEYFECIAVTEATSTEACKGLKKRLKKIIKRYNTV